MKVINRIFGLAAAAAMALAASPSFAASIISQPVCAAAGSGICKSFDFDDTIPLIRGLRFTMPRAGSALITFEGSMTCSTSGRTDNVIDLVSQITTTASEVPTVAGPSGLRHAGVLRGVGSTFFGVSDSYNLASTRVINYPTAGDKLVYFQFNRLRMDAGSSCVVYNATFSVVTTP